MSLFLLVEMDSPATRNAAFGKLMKVDGVKQVTDVEYISRSTLDHWLLPVEQTWEYQQKHRPAKVPSAGKSHRVRHQPGLL